jgi:hypothetical protein
MRVAATRILAIGLIMFAAAAFAASPLGVPPIPQPGDESRDPSNKEMLQKLQKAMQDAKSANPRDAKSASPSGGNEIRDAKTANPAQNNQIGSRGKSSGEVEGTQSTDYTVPLACPQDSTLTLTVPATNLPPLWSQTGRRLVLAFAAVNDVAGKQELSCHYDLQASAAVPDVTALRRSVNLSSCIVAPDKRSFRCRQGRF